MCDMSDYIEDKDKALHDSMDEILDLLSTNYLVSSAAIIVVLNEQSEEDVNITSMHAVTHGSNYEILGALENLKYNKLL